MTQVNSPTFLRGLASIAAKDKDQSLLFEQIIRVLEQQYNRSGGSTDTVETIENAASPITISRFLDVESKIGSGDALTSDETGFTVDSSLFTVDMTEA